MALDSTVRVALAGYGLAGRVFHAPLVAATPAMSLDLVVTSNAERAAQVVADHPAARVVASTEDLLAMAQEWDLLVIATTNDVHAPLALAALAAGKAVVVDKPVATTSADGRRVVEAAEEAGLLLTVFQNRRWDSDLLTLQRLRATGELGDVVRFESRFERWRPEIRDGAWREILSGEEGGGLLLDLGSHLVDQALHLFGPARRVYAEVDARRGASDDDVFVAIEHLGGTRSHLWAGALAGSPGPRLRVLGTRGAYVVDGLDGQEDVLRATGRPAVGGLAEPPERWGRLVRGADARPVPSEPGRWDTFYPQVAAAFAGAGPVPVEPRDAVRALEVIEAARRSAAEHQVVDL